MKCGDSQYYVKGDSCYEIISGRTMVQHPQQKGFYQHYPAGGTMPRKKRHHGRACSGQCHAHKLSSKIIPFKLTTEIKAIHTFTIKKPLKKLDNNISSEAFSVTR